MLHEANVLHLYSISLAASIVLNNSENIKYGIPGIFHGMYFTVKHGTRIFANFVDEGYPKVFAFFMPFYMAIYEEFMLLF